MKEKTGAEILLDILEEEGVEVIFGYPGGAVIPIYDELYKRKSIKHILVRHEQGAAHAADGYARSTGRVGVCIATSGPGATNLVTGIATAFMDSIPIVAFTGQVPTTMIGNDSFQEADIYGITIPITKYNYIVKDVKDLPRIVKEAFYIAKTGRPGPVLIDLPKDVQIAKIANPDKIEIDINLLNDLETNYENKIEKFYKLLDNARKPLLYIGGGVIHSGAAYEVRKFIEKVNIPVISTLMALGAVPSDHPLFLGMVGMHGTRAANYAVSDCDLLIAIGARFDDRVTGKLSAFAPEAQVIHIDIDAAEIGKVVKPVLYIVDSAKRALEKLNAFDYTRSPNKWNEIVKEWKEKFPLTYKNSDTVIKPQYVVERLSEITKGEAIICTEVGQNQMWAAQFYKFKYPRQFVTSGGLGTMGYGLPASNGAKVGNPDKVVWDIAGDGSILMNIQELATAVEEKIPVKIAVLNNSCLGMVRQWQELFFQRRYSATIFKRQVDLVKIAEGFGAKAIRVANPKDVDKAIEKAMEYNDGPFLIDFIVAQEENVFPMVPAGGANREMLIQEDLEKE